MKHVRFKSIEGFKNIKRQVEMDAQYVGKDEDGIVIVNRNATLPKITFNATVKIHGTNGGVRLNPDGSIVAQSRERDVTIESDNAGFAAFVEANKSVFEEIFKLIAPDLQPYEPITIFGEWAGGNIQKGVAINGVDRFFAIFAFKKGEEYIKLPPKEYFEQFNCQRIFHIEQFGFCTYVIDFNDDLDVAAKVNMINEHVLAVENECPIGKFFGQSGIGEGLVLVSTCGRYTFKAKGEKHSVSKVSKPVTINEEELKTVMEFIDYAVTENRLKQGIAYMEEMGLDILPKNTGAFIKWVSGDVLKEEKDAITKLSTEHLIDWKTIAPMVANKARQFYSNYEGI
jgi:hypothetical protein